MKRAVLLGLLLTACSAMPAMDAATDAQQTTETGVDATALDAAEPDALASDVQCAPMPDALIGLCDGRCANVWTEQENCGSCGRACPAPGTCRYGGCFAPDGATVPR